MRHLSSGIDCAIAGAATAAPAMPSPVALMKSRRFMQFSLWVMCLFRLFVKACRKLETSWPQFPDRTCAAATQKARPPCGGRAFVVRLILGSAPGARPDHEAIEGIF